MHRRIRTRTLPVNDKQELNRYEIVQIHGKIKNLMTCCIKMYPSMTARYPLLYSKCTRFNKNISERKYVQYSFCNLHPRLP
ncbi:hypothetical protein Hanom_Chr09g00821411 [Helianthus anomalus]